MADPDAAWADLDIALEFRVTDPETSAALQAAFADEEILTAHAFSGAEVLTVITTLSKKTLDKLITFFATPRTTTPKTTFKIGKNDITMTGYSREDVEALLASPHFKAAVRAVRKT